LRLIEHLALDREVRFGVGHTPELRMALQILCNELHRTPHPRRHSVREARITRRLASRLIEARQRCYSVGRRWHCGVFSCARHTEAVPPPPLRVASDRVAERGVMGIRNRAAVVVWSPVVVAAATGVAWSLVTREPDATPVTRAPDATPVARKAD